MIAMSLKDGLNKDFAMEILPATTIKGRRAPVELFKEV